MRRILTFISLICCAMMSMAQYQDVKEKKAEDNRPLAEFAQQKKVLWNFDWEFSTKIVNGKLSNSRLIDLPHDFQFEQPWTKDGGGARGFKPMCEGWYRKTFVAEEAWKGLNVKLDFGGILYYGDVYINGEKVASTDYGYVGLEADLTKHLKWGEENEVKVYASTGRKGGSRWYTGGGLFRDVYLMLENPTHIARHGVFVKTAPLSAPEGATIVSSANSNTKEAPSGAVGGAWSASVQVEVTGWHGHDVTIKARVLDADGKVVGTTEGQMPKFTHHTTEEVALPVVQMQDAHLWSPDTPYLYSVDVLVYDGTVLVDSVNESFGLRTLEFSPEFGFKLNGKKIFLQGNSGHHDLGALGAASYDRAIERMMLQLKAFGYNTIRCSHNPYSESFTKIADRVGMLIVDELTDKWSGYWGGRQPFTALWPGLIKEWVTRDRNSPSVILWSLGNELQMREDLTGYQGLNDWGVTMYRIMDPVVKRFDPTRLTTVAMFPSRAGAIGHREKTYKDYTMPPELAQVTEVASLNYQSAWYGEFKKHCPEMNIFQSEAETSNWLTAYYNMDREHSIGMAYWGSIEYWGESNGWPKKGWNYSFFSHTLEPYPTAWLVKSAFCEDEPVIRMGILDAKGSESVSWNDIQVGQTSLLSHWNFEASPSPSKGRETKRVYVFTNAPQAELFLNGKSLGSKQNDGKGNMQHVITWDVDYQPGSLLAIARDANGKETARHELQTAGKAVKLIIEEDVVIKSKAQPNSQFLRPFGSRSALATLCLQRMRPKVERSILNSCVPSVASDQRSSAQFFKADGMDLKYLNITAVDGKGRVVPDYDEPLTINITGPASLLALDNGDHYTDELFAGINTKKMRNGKMQVVLRSGKQKGAITVKASTPKMKATMKLSTQ